MPTEVERWDNVLPIRIPESFALDANLEDDSAVEISVVKGKRIIAPVVAQLWTLDELLVSINSDGCIQD